MQIDQNSALCCYIFNGTHAATFVYCIMVDASQHFQFAVVRTDVFVYHLFGSTILLHTMSQIIESHIAIENPVIVQTHPCKAIIIIPRLHFRNHFLNVSFQHIALLIITEHFAYFGFAESHHGIESFVYRDIPVNIIPAGQVVQRDRTDAHQKDAIEHPFELLEVFTIKSAIVVFSLR